jgi:hypothetical protein
MSKKQEELPGVESPSIPEIDTAAAAYVKVRDRRMKLTEDECAAKAKLIEVVTEHKKELTPNGDGERTYRFDDFIVILKPGRDNVKVRTDNGPDEPEEE